MSTLNDISVPSDKFYALSVLTGQPIGTSVELQTKSTYPILVIQSPTQPSPSDSNGRTLYDSKSLSGYLTITGNEEVWLKSKSPFESLSVSGKISVEVL